MGYFAVFTVARPRRRWTHLPARQSKSSVRVQRGRPCRVRCAFVCALPELKGSLHSRSTGAAHFRSRALRVTKEPIGPRASRTALSASQKTQVARAPTAGSSALACGREVRFPQAQIRAVVDDLCRLQVSSTSRLRGSGRSRLKGLPASGERVSMGSLHSRLKGAAHFRSCALRETKVALWPVPEGMSPE